MSSGAKIVFMLLLLCCSMVGGMAQDAAGILDKSAQFYEQSNGIKAKFTLHTSIPRQNVSESLEGVIQMKQDKFKLETPGMTTWYDGTTQWVYVERNEEVNVSTPTGDELQFTNPALILRTYKKGFTAAYEGTSTTRQAKAAYDITLTPNKKSDIKRIDMQIEKLTCVPVAFTVTDKKGANYSIYISQWQTGVNQKDDVFVFNEKDFPDAEIVDLR